ncbi:hypothetical protein GF358_01125 [Candidatus Woesearchaeota archaeon]|nr:hypothetical protein [Candidatus Woesearchaeota archaeon]
MKKTILFLVILVLLSSTAAAIYQEPAKIENVPSRNILIKTVQTTDGITRQFTTGGAIIRTEREAWSPAGTDETPEDSRYAIPYSRRQSFAAGMEYGTQAHAAAITSQKDMNRWEIFRRTTPSVLARQPQARKETSHYFEKKEENADIPAREQRGILQPVTIPKNQDTEGFMRINRAGEKRQITGNTVLPGEESKYEPAFEGKYPPLMPGEARPYNPEESGFTDDYLYTQKRMKMSKQPGNWIRTGAAVTTPPELIQSPKGSNPYAIGGAGKTVTAGQAVSRGEKPLTARENPYALGGTGKPLTAGQAEIDAELRRRQSRAQSILAQMQYR